MKNEKCHGFGWYGRHHDIRMTTIEKRRKDEGTKDVPSLLCRAAREGGSDG